VVSVGRLQKLFSAITKPRRFSGITNFLPARLFEAETGISGISGHYVFPGGLSAAEYQHYVVLPHYEAHYRPDWNKISECGNPDFMEYKRKDWDKRVALNPELASEPGPAVTEQLRKDWDELVALNSELEKVSLNRDDGLALREALYGVVSQFNTDDINFYLKTWGERQELTITKWREIGLTAGASVRWIAAPETMQKIASALEAKTGRPVGWVLLPENQKKITSFLEKKCIKPDDTPARAAEIKALLAGPVDGWYEDFCLEHLKEVSAMLKKGTPKKTPKPHR
jgi:hypothetical protein